jgi:polyisoprenoid-binding protein YceI
MRKLVILFMLLSLPVIFAGAQNVSVRTMADKKSSSITYSMKHPLHSWSGTSRDVSSVILSNGKKYDIQEVAVSVKVSTFDSKNANRDSHMIEVTEAIRFPNITFSGKVISKKENQLDVSGELTFHGISRPLNFEVTTTEKGGKLEVTGGFTVTLTEFNIQRPTLMGLPANDEIKVDFSITY